MIRCEACSGRGWIPVVKSDGNILRVIDALTCSECASDAAPKPAWEDLEADVTEAVDGG